MRVLVVDDYQVLRRFIREQLRRLGVEETEEAASGPEALKKMRAIAFDLVMVDWNMEPMSGLQLVTQMRCSADFSNIPVLFMTGDLTTVNRQQAGTLASGDIIVKSQKLDALRNALMRIGFVQAADLPS